MQHNTSNRPQWKTTALASAIAAVCVNNFMISPVMASPACGPVISVNQGQCVPGSTDNIIIQNSVTVSGNDTAAIYYYGDLGAGTPVEGSITNSGTVSSSGAGLDYGDIVDDQTIAGIRINGELLGSVINNGLISGNATGEVDQEDSVSYGILEKPSDFLDMQGSILNSGVISATTNNDYGYGSAEGIYLENSLASTASINNTSTGVIKTEVNAKLSGYAYTIDISEALEGDITNSGTISAQSASSEGYSDSNAIYIGDGIAVDASITNNSTGIISAESSGLTGSEAYAIYIDGSLDGTINNNGDIISSLSNAYYAGSIYVEAFAGEINNNGNILLNLRDESNPILITAAAVHIDNMNGGVLNNTGLISAGNVDGGEGYSIYVGIDGYDVSSSGTVNNEASGTLRGMIATGYNVDVNNAGVIDLSDNTNPSFIGGGFTQTDTGTFKITAVSDLENGFSRISVLGSANIAGKAFVNVKEVNSLAVGQTLRGVVRATDLTGNFSQVDDNSALFNFVSLSTEGEDGHIDLQLVKALTVVDAVNENRNFPSLGSASALDAIIDAGTTSANMQRVIDALGQLETSQQVSAAASQTQPQQNANTVQGARAALGGISKIIEARMDANRGMSAGEEFYGDRKVWLKPFASKADQDNRGGVAGFDADTAGAVFGVDGTLSDRDRVGFALAYAQTNIDSSSATAPNSADVDMFQLIGYGSHSINASTELNYKLGVGQNRTDSQRRISFLNETAKAKYTSMVVSAGVGVAKTIQLNDKTSFTPSVRTDFTSVRNESYRETGSSANLNVGAQTNDELVLGIEGKITHSFTPGLRVIANLGVGYDALNDANSVTASFAAEPGFGFSTSGLDVSPWRQNAGLALVHDAANGAELSVRVDTERSEGFSNNTLSAKVRVAF